MIPGPWVALVLALAAYRLVRLLGWDDFPPVARARVWLLGEHLMDEEEFKQAMNDRPPGVEEVGWYAYRRPLLAALFHCPFCLGFWVSLAVYVAWLLSPRGTLYALAAFALSGFVGLVAKNLDE